MSPSGPAYSTGFQSAPHVQYGEPNSIPAEVCSKLPISARKRWGARAGEINIVCRRPAHGVNIEACGSIGGREALFLPSIGEIFTAHHWGYLPGANLFVPASGDKLTSSITGPGVTHSEYLTGRISSPPVLHSQTCSASPRLPKPQPFKERPPDHNHARPDRFPPPRDRRRRR